MSDQAPAGWHPQPDGRERYWDGQQWTDQFRPAHGLAATPAAAPATKKKGPGCMVWGLVALGVLVLLGIIGALIGGDDKSTSASSSTTAPAASSAPAATEAAPAPSSAEPAPAAPQLSGPQKNAARAAQNYLRFSAFSRDGLIAQLSSDVADKYSIEDATAAVDSLNVDWNEQAKKAAENYLKMTAFSCDGLIQQLSSEVADKYTLEQATYGAQQTSACQ